MTRSKGRFSLFQALALVVLIFSLVYLAYGLLIEKSNETLMSKRKELEEKIQAQDQVLGSLKSQQEEISRNQDNRTQDFIKAQGFHPNKLTDRAIKEEIAQYKKKQDDLVQAVQSYIKGEAFQKPFYENDDMVVFLGKYADLSSSSRNEKHQGNLWDELKASEILDLVLEDPLYQGFYQVNASSEINLKSGILHQVYLGYDLYRLAKGKPKNLDDLTIAFELYVQGLENLQEEGFNVQAFNLEDLQARRASFQQAYKDYLTYQGIINQLEELEHEDQA